jgi:hypothetical protein
MSFKEINERFDKIGDKYKDELEQAKIKPISDTFPFAQNGITAMIAGMGSGKTYNYLKIIAKQEQLNEEPFFETVVICSTSSHFDRTVQTFREAILKTTLIPVKDTDLLKWIENYLDVFTVYNTIMKFIKNGSERIDEDMMKLIENNRMIIRRRGDKIEIDIDRLNDWIAKTLKQIGWKTYPHRCLLILDDFASHPLLKRKEDELSRMLKKLRHFLMTVIICVQTVKSIPKDIKRNLSDLILFPGISEYDFKELIREIPGGFNFEEVWEYYRQLSNKHDMFTLHITGGKIIITPAII